MGENRNQRRFSERIFAVPFGRYQSGSELGTSNDVLVGREEQRSYFIELLLRMGRRGAYLVTGRRGVGKTSFVNYCLDEYKEEVFERFLRSSVGRVMFWDQIGVMLLGLGVIFVLLMISEFMEILTISTGWGKGNNPNILFGLVIIPMVLICLSPLLYAREVMVRVWPFGRRGAYGREVSATLFTLVLAAGAFMVPPFGAPALSVSRMFLAICALYLWVQSTSFNFKNREGKAKKLLSLIGEYGPVLVAFAAVVWGPYAVTGFSMLKVATVGQEFFGNIFWGLCLFATGNLFRGRHLSSLEGSGKGIKIPHGRHWLFGWTLLVCTLATFFYFLFKDANHDASVPLVDYPSLIGIVASVIIACGVFLLRGRLFWSTRAVITSGDLPPSFRPRPRLALTAKSLLSIVVTLQLVHPIFDRLTPAQASPKGLAGYPLDEEPPARRTATPLYRISSLSEKEKIYRDAAASIRSQLEAKRRRLDQSQTRLAIEERIWRARALESDVDGAQHDVLEEQRTSVRREQKEVVAEALDVEINLKRADLFRQRRDTAVFYGRTEELSWVLGLFLCLVIIFLMEHDWVLAPFVREREDGALDLAGPSPWQDQISDAILEKKEFRSLAHVTLPWVVYNKWLPILTVSVNLGFEKLDHRRVVHAMLAGLRDQYHRAFRAWNSGLANLGRVFGFLLLMMLVTLAGDRWFSMPNLPLSSVDPRTEEFVHGDYAEICQLFQGLQKGPAAANWICKLKWGNEIFHILYYNVLDAGDLKLYRERDLHLLFYIFPYREEAWPPDEAWRPGLGEKPIPLLVSGIHFRVYHIVLFAVIFLIGRWMLHNLPIFPYQEIIRRIDDTMDSLAARTSVTSTSGRWKPAQWLQGFFIDERVRQTEQDPVDPRTVEFVFSQILRDIQSSTIHLPGGRNQLISLPTPEVTFVLDELDKIGTRVDPDEGGSSGGTQQAEILSAERRRSMELHKLLADMKSLLSSAPARFIFVGGRNLHDEWLADQTARQPLLTNIFTAEIYLPSLLTDHSEEAKRLHSQVVVYLRNQLDRAKTLFHVSHERRWSNLLALPFEEYERESYVNPGVSRDDLIEISENLKVFDSERSPESSIQTDLIRDFVQFLTYRSMGNPKKLKELLSSFVRPAGRVVGKDKEYRWHDEFKYCDHVLFFGDTERFRIQLLARVYRHLTGHFEHDLVRRDDKLAASVLYLTDFLFKFHRRAFSWSNLERVDELVHIHRAPDLREILEAIVAQWSERFLHPIRNGMYDFRFRSDMAREIEFISRQSAEEMAAFNFTLDESQTLKSAYETNITRLSEENGAELQDLVAGLGELHEFDQEYETARLYYRRAISLLDQELEDVMGGSVLSESSSRIEIIGGKAGGQENARLYMTWGVARLRLMLQIGMTFEHSRNLERAAMEYQNARTLSDALLLASLDDEGRHCAAAVGVYQTKDSLSFVGEDRLHALKHLNIIFQPIFAEAWTAEKLSGGVDTSTTLAETELWKLRNVLPFVRDQELHLSKTGVEARGSNFALIATELHNKVGDLYFFKGRQVPKIRILNGNFSAEECSKRSEGYLLSAHYHYAVGLHELRRFIVHRKRSSEWKLNFWPASWETISPEGWPDFVLRAVGGAFNDLAEALLARVSLLELLTFPDPSPAPGNHLDLTSYVEEVTESSTGWLEWDDIIGNTPTRDIPFLRTGALHLPGQGISLGTWDEWLGTWKWDLPKKRLIEFSSQERHADANTFLFSLGISLVGAQYLKKGGYIEDAGRELLKVCETVNYYLWWALMVRRVAEKQVNDNALINAGWPYLFDIGLHALEEAAKLFRRSRGRMDADEGKGKISSGLEDSSLVGEVIPVFAMTLACSLGLVARQWDRDVHVEKSLRKLLNEWIGRDFLNSEEVDFATEIRRLLKNSLVHNSYPMLNRLYTLKLLIDDTVLGAVHKRKEEKEPSATVSSVIDWTRELLDLEASLNAPLHFTPLDWGATCALVYLLWEAEGPVPDRILHAAERALLSSQEMYSMRRAFYENISDLYYLYDDFNDRQLHFNHAIQMAGAELASLLQGHLVLNPNELRRSKGEGEKKNTVAA